MKLPFPELARDIAVSTLAGLAVLALVSAWGTFANGPSLRALWPFGAGLVIAEAIILPPVVYLRQVRLVSGPFRVERVRSAASTPSELTPVRPNVLIQAPAVPVDEKIINVEATMEPIKLHWFSFRDDLRAQVINAGMGGPLPYLGVVSVISNTAKPMEGLRLRLKGVEFRGEPDVRHGERLDGLANFGKLSSGASTENASIGPFDLAPRETVRVNVLISQPLFRGGSFLWFLEDFNMKVLDSGQSTFIRQ